VHDEHQSETEKVLKSVVRAEKVPDPSLYVGPILERVEHKNIYDIYGVHEWEDTEDFLKQLCKKTGKLLKGGEPDINNVSKQIIVDWQRGNIPFFTRPPRSDEEEKLENERINVIDPNVPNPIEKVKDELVLNEAQSALLAHCVAHKHEAGGNLIQV